MGVYLKVLHFESGLKRHCQIVGRRQLTVGFTNKTIAIAVPIAHKTDLS